MYLISLICVLIFIQHGESQTITVSPNPAIVFPGQNVSIVFQLKTNEPASTCKMKFFTKPNLFNRISVSNTRTKNNFNNMELQYSFMENTVMCTLSITNITESNNGNILFDIIPARLTTSTSVIVAQAPTRTQMNETYVDFQKVGDKFNASCFVYNGRPAAKFVWYLDNEEITDGLFKPVIVHDRETDLYNVTQNISRKLEMADDRKIISCVAQHIALNGSNDQKVSRRLKVRFAPFGNKTQRFTIDVNKTLNSIPVGFFANPRPFIQWEIGDETISEGRFKTKPIVVERLHYNTRNYYVSTLNILNATDDITELNFTLHIRNRVDEFNISVVLTTAAEPSPQVSSEHLWLIGYIIIVLVLLFLIIFIIIYTRLTNRCCFSESTSRGHGNRLNSKDQILTYVKMQSPPKPELSNVETQLNDPDNKNDYVSYINVQPLKNPPVPLQVQYIHNKAEDDEEMAEYINIQPVRSLENMSTQKTTQNTKQNYFDEEPIYSNLEKDDIYQNFNGPSLPQKKGYIK